MDAGILENHPSEVLKMDKNEQIYNLSQFRIPYYLVEILLDFDHTIEINYNRYFEIANFHISIYDNTKTLKERQAIVSQLRKINGVRVTIDREHGWAQIKLPVKIRGPFGYHITVHRIAERFTICSAEDRKKVLKDLLTKEYLDGS